MHFVEHWGRGHGWIPMNSAFSNLILLSAGWAAAALCTKNMLLQCAGQDLMLFAGLPWVRVKRGVGAVWQPGFVYLCYVCACVTRISVRCVHLCVYGADGTSNRMYVPQACVNWIKTTSKDQSYSCGILFLVVFWDVFRKCIQILEIHWFALVNAGKSRFTSSRTGLEHWLLNCQSQHWLPKRRQW